MGLRCGNARILVAEDSEDDAFFLSYAFREAGLAHSLTFVSNGQRAIEYLQKEPRPDLVVLDLKMPKVNGFEVLQWIQQHAEFRGMPVVVFSSSDLSADKKRAKDLGAAGYLVKSSNWAGFVKELDSKFLRKS